MPLRKSLTLKFPFIEFIFFLFLVVILNKFALLSTFQFSKKLFGSVFNLHLKFTNQKGRHYKKIAIPTTLLLFHFFQFDRCFIPSKVTEIDSERIEFSFRKKIESFYCIVREIISFKVETNQKGRRYSILLQKK